MSQAAIPLHRQAIEDGLREFLDDASLQQAMDHWQRQYADQPSTALQRFVSDIYSAYDISASRATVLRSLLKAINLNGDALPGDPKSRRTGAPLNQRSEAFSLLIDAIMVQLEAEEQRRLLLEYFAALRKKHLPPGLLITLQSWLAKRDASAAPNADNAQLRFLLNQLYILLCDHLGPVKADRCLARAVNNVNQQYPSMEELVSQFL